ncbi:MAG: Hsp20/alpha crystallin family protein [Succinatimonas sp.]|nr:Hsp20/alpha crystallin family protein [Succinatimonas sp.]
MKNNIKAMNWNEKHYPTILDLFNRPLCDIDLLGKDYVNNFQSMKTDVIDKGDCYQLKTELPGVKKDDIHVDFTDGVLTISAERKFEKHKDDQHGFIMREHSEGTCSRSFSFEDVDPENIDAVFANGELDIRLKKHTKQQSKKICIH